MVTADVGNNGSIEVSHKYDALGRRVSRTEASTTTVFALSGQQVICDYALGAAPAASTYRYLYASYIDEPIMRRATSGGAQLYYHRNQQYSIVAMTNSSGAVQERYAYTAYGVPTIANASGTVLTTSAINNRYMYTGREWDNVIGQYYYRARMYDAGLGRFCSRDPIGYKDGPSQYRAYFAPQGIDPTGLANLWNPWTWGTGGNTWGEFVSPSAGYQGFGSGYVDNLNPYNGTATPSVDWIDSALTGGTMVGHGMVVVGSGGAAFVYGTGIGAGVTLTWGGVGTALAAEVVDTSVEEGLTAVTGVPVMIPVSPFDLLQDGGKLVCRRLWRACPPRISNPVDEIAGAFDPQDYVDDGFIHAGPYFGVDAAWQGVSEGFEVTYGNGIQEILLPGNIYDDMLENGTIVPDGFYPSGTAVYAPTESLSVFNRCIQQGPDNIYHPPSK